MTIMDQSGLYLTASEAAIVLDITLSQLFARGRRGQYPAFIGEIPADPPIVILLAALGLALNAPALARLPPVTHAL